MSEPRTTVPSGAPEPVGGPSMPEYSPDFWDALVLAFAADKLGLQDFGGWG